VQLLDRDRELCKKVAVDVEMTLVLSEIAKLMSFAQNARNLRAEPERVGHSLKHNVAIVRTISVPPQSSESERVSGILRQRKSALGSKCLVASIGHARAPRGHQSIELTLGTGL